MYAPTVSRRKLFWMVFVAIVILVLVPMLLAAAPPAPPPIGTWSGTTYDGRVVTMSLTEDGGFYLEGTTNEPVRAVWTWEPMPASRTGVMRCEPAEWRAHPTMLYNVVWLDDNRVELSNYYFKVVLRREV